LAKNVAGNKQNLGGGATAQIELRDGATWVALAGNLTELADFTPLTQLRGPLRIDLGGVERINSVGVRTWLDFVARCESQGVRLAFERCSPAIVLQISMISNFIGHAQVSSVLVPYLCGACGAEPVQQVAVTRGAPVAVARSLPCPKCGAAMQLDELEDMYATLFAR
jgi:ABC-type transporter Mla MlaB component